MGKFFIKKGKNEPKIIQSENDYYKLVVELPSSTTKENLISE